MSNPLRYLIFSFVALATAAKIALVFRSNIHWDEFIYLTRIYEFERGALGRSFQTVYVHFFGWLAYFGSTEIIEIRLGRGLALLAHALSGALIYLYSKNRWEQGVAAWSLLFFSIYSTQFYYAIQLRSDPFVLFFALTSIVLIQEQKVKCLWLAAISLALSLLFSAKALVFVPLVFFEVLRNFQKIKCRSLMDYFSQTIFFVCIAMILHALIIKSKADPASLASPALEAVRLSLVTAAKRVFLTEGFLPKGVYFDANFRENFAHYFLIALGAICFGKLKYKKNIVEILCIIFPLLAVLLYRNAFPYYYVLVAPCVCVFAGYAFFNINTRIRYAVLFLALVLGASSYVYRFKDSQSKQVHLVNRASALFPQRPPYFNDRGVLPRNPMANNFISGWTKDWIALEKNGHFVKSFDKFRPPLIIATNGCFNPALTNLKHCSFLKSEDVEMFINNYQHLEGPIFTLVVNEVFDPKQARRLRFINQGFYLIQGSGHWLINNVKSTKGDLVFINGEIDVVSLNKNKKNLSLRFFTDKEINQTDYRNVEFFDGFDSPGLFKTLLSLLKKL